MQLDRAVPPAPAESASPPPAPAARGRLPVWGFFALSHGFSWSFWLAAAAWGGTDVWESSARWLVYLGGLGPLLAGVTMIYLAGGPRALRELGARIIDPRRIPARWLAAALLLPPLMMGGAIAAAALLGRAEGAVDASQLVALLANPLSLLSFALFVMIFGPVPEEIGWRGYALDALQARWSALGASLLIGAAWALWHAPLFFIPGYYGVGGPPDPLLFTVAILVHSVLYTWIYNHTRRSVLAAILFHFMINFVGMLVEGDALVEWTRTGLTAAVALAAIWISGARTLRRIPAAAVAGRGAGRAVVSALFVLVLVAGAGCARQPTAAGDPLEAFAAHLDRRIPVLMEQYDVPGLGIALVRGGQPVWSAAYGYADRQQRRPMSLDAVYRAESISKSVTAWGVMRLVEEGRIRLDDPVQQHLGGWTFPDSPYDERQVTVRRLLSHSAGMPLGAVGPPAQFSPRGAVPALRDVLSEEARLVREPGSGYAYSNVGYHLLELLIEEVTGRDFAEYMASEVLMPLGMHPASFRWNETIGASLPTAYDLRGGVVPPYVYAAKASGGLFATVDDLARFASAGMAGSDQRVLTRDGLRQLHTPQVAVAGIYAVVAEGYGFGHFVETLSDGRQALWHGGQGNGWMTDFRIVPESGDGIVMLTNSQRSWPLMGEVLSDWSRWNGVAPVKMGRITYGTTALRVLTGLVVLLSLWLLYRLATGLRRGARRLAPFSREARTARLLQAAMATGLIAALAWSAAQPYLTVSSIFPGLAERAGLAFLFLAVVVLLSALFPRVERRRGRSGERGRGHARVERLGAGAVVRR